MNRYCFIIPRTPDRYRTVVRDDLWLLTKKSLREQKFSDWTALIVYDDNEEMESDQRFEYLQSEKISKGDKIDVAIKYLQKHDLPNFIIRLDDDDIMMPDALNNADNLTFDVYADKEQIFYDLSSSLMSKIELPWMPNTIIHRTEHALKFFNDTGNYLINHDHSKKWHLYYQGKKIYNANLANPIYVRILSPLTVTAKREKDYKDYLNRYGKWNFGYPQSILTHIDFLKRITDKHDLKSDFKPKSRLNYFIDRLLVLFKV